MTKRQKLLSIIEKMDESKIDSIFSIIGIATNSNTSGKPSKVLAVRQLRKVVEREILNNLYQTTNEFTPKGISKFIADRLVTEENLVNLIDHLQEG